MLTQYWVWFLPEGSVLFVYPTTSSVRRDHEKRSRPIRPRRTLGAAAGSGCGSGSERGQQVQEHTAGWPERQQPAWCCRGRAGPGQQVPGARYLAAASGAATGSATGSAASTAPSASSGSATGASSGSATAAAATPG